MCHPRMFKNKNDKLILDQVAVERNIQHKTLEGYYNSVFLFIEYTGRSLTDSLHLYEKEEEELVWKRRTIKKDLLGFRTFLQVSYLENTAKVYMQRLLAVLRHLDLELMPLPNISKKNTITLPPITHEDLLTHEELAEALGLCNPKMKAYLTFAVSSGCARAEACSLTVYDYLIANGFSNLEKLDNLKIRYVLGMVDTDFIPLFKLKRIKTNKHYFTFCSSQANKYIKEFLLSDTRDLSLDSPLFGLNKYYLDKYCTEINDELSLGSARKYKRFRSHMFRKYHASTLYNNGMHMEDVDTLQGRSKDSVHNSYFMESPEKLKDKYCEFVECLII